MKGDERITVLIEPGLRLQLKETAERCRTNMSRIIEKALEKYLKEAKS